MFATPISVACFFLPSLCMHIVRTSYPHIPMRSSPLLDHPPPPAPGSRGLSTARYLSIPAEHENLLLFCLGNPPPPRVHFAPGPFSQNVKVIDRGGLKKKPTQSQSVAPDVISALLSSARPGQARARSKSRPALATAPPPTERDQLFPTCPLTCSPRSRLAVFFFSFFPSSFLG